MENGLIAGEDVRKLHKELLAGQRVLKSGKIINEKDKTLVTARITYLLRDLIASKDVSIAYCIKRGYAALCNDAEYVDRIKDNETDITKLTQKVRELAIKNNSLTAEIQKITQKKLVP